MTEMAEIDHTHPYTDEGFDVTFRRGVTVVADGGVPGAGSGGTDQSMKDVHHEAPTEGAVRSFERGTEGRDETA